MHDMIILSKSRKVEQQYQPFAVWMLVVVGLMSGGGELVWVQVLLLSQHINEYVATCNDMYLPY